MCLKCFSHSQKKGYPVKFDLYDPAGPLTGAENTLVSQGGRVYRTSLAQLLALAGNHAGQEALEADRTYYVRTNGSDDNLGLSNDSLGAFRTIQKAVNTAVALNLNGHRITIQVAGGLYTEAVKLPRYDYGSDNSSRIELIGDVVTPANVEITTPAGHVIEGAGEAIWQLKGFRFTAQGAYTGCVVTNNFSTIALTGPCEYRANNATAYANIAFGGTISWDWDSSYKFIGGAWRALVLAMGVAKLYLETGSGFELVGAPVFGGAAVWAGENSLVYFDHGQPFVGTATGPRLNLGGHTQVETYGAGFASIPGSTNGTIVNSATFDGMLGNATVPVAAVAGLATALADVGRDYPSSTRTYYVRKDGSDANDGLSNTAGGAFLTIQAAINKVVQELDLSKLPFSPADWSFGYIRIQVGAGTYAENLSLAAVPGQRYQQQLQLIGDPATPSNVVLQVTNGGAGVVYAGGSWMVDGFKLDLQNAFAGIYSFGLLSPERGQLSLGNLWFKAPAAQTWVEAIYVYSSVRVGTDTVAQPYVNRMTFEGNFGFGIDVEDDCMVNFSPTHMVLLPGTNFDYFASVNGNAQVIYRASSGVTGTATGRKYYVQTPQGMFTSVSGDSAIPGDIPGRFGNPAAREKVTASRTYYVSTTGSDNYDLRSGRTPSDAFRTIQYAVRLIAETLDLRNDPNVIITIQVADGTYTERVNLLPAFNSYHPIRLVGNSANPGNVIIDAPAPTATGLSFSDSNTLVRATGARWWLDGFTLQSNQTGYQVLLSLLHGAQLEAGSLKFKAPNTADGTCGIRLDHASSFLSMSGAGYTFDIAGRFGYFLNAAGGSVADLETGVLTLAPGVTFDNSFVALTQAVAYFYWDSVTGTAVGKRYSATYGSTIFSFWAGQSYLPGDVAGELLDTSTYDGLMGAPGVVPMTSVIGLSAALVAATERETLTADRTYYVRKDGSDSNNGLADTAGGAFLTIGKAMLVVGTKLDLNGKMVTILVGAGTYNERVEPPPVNGALRLMGNGALPSDVVITNSGVATDPQWFPAVITNQLCEDFQYGKMRLKLYGNWGGASLTLNGGYSSFCGDVEFENAGSSNMALWVAMGAHHDHIFFNEKVTLLGNFRYPIIAKDGASLYFAPAVLDVTGQSGEIFAQSLGSSFQIYLSSVVGTMTGKKFEGVWGGVFTTWGQGLSAMPGTTVGTLSDDSSFDGVTGLQLNSKVREVLTANRTYYVRADGNDANTGLVDSAAGAFLTIQKAVSVVCSKLDLAFSDYTVTIQVGAGTFSGLIQLGPVAGLKHPTHNGTPDNYFRRCKLVGAGVTSVLTDSVEVWGADAQWYVSGFKLNWTTHYRSVAARNYATLYIGTLSFESTQTTNTCFYAYDHATIEMDYDAVITTKGTFDSVFTLSLISAVLAFPDNAFVLDTVPNFNTAFVSATENSLMMTYMNFTGTATGKRYSVTGGSGVVTYGSGAAFFPGSLAGTTDASSTYDGITADGVIPQSSVTGLTAALALAGNGNKEVLAANRTYYVRKDGSDANNGLSNTAGGAFLTISAAIAAVSQKLNFNGKTVTIQVGTGIYNEGIYHNTVTGGPLSIVGDVATPSNVKVVSPVYGARANGRGVILLLSGLYIDISAARVDDAAVLAQNGADCEILDNCELNLGALRERAFVSSGDGSYLGCWCDTLVVHGGSNTGCFMSANFGGQVDIEPTILNLADGLTIATGDSSYAFISLSFRATAWLITTITGGAVVGKKFSALNNAIISTAGAGASYIPGTVAGTMDDTSSYDGATGLQYNGTIYKLKNTGAAKTSAYAVQQTDQFVAVNTTAGAVTVTLPAAPVDGQTHYIKKVSTDANDMVLDGNGKLIDGAAAQTTSAQTRPSFTVTYVTALGYWSIL